MTQTGFPDLKIEHTPVTLREIVQEKMREAIIEGHFEPGQRLVERPLCDQLGVSRTVVRETIRYLEAEGLVEILPNKGPIVANLDWDDARQIYDIRRMLESAAAMACAELGDKKTRKALKAALADLEKAFDDGSPRALFKATAQFYEVIFVGAGHAIAWEVVNRLNGRISRLRVMTLSTADRKKPGLGHMTAIYSAIADGNPKTARDAVHAHIDDASAVAKRLLDQEEE
ncbi:GntR family transcriptional regulator [Falsiruegeria mediterranea]|jgi:GntR family transcriptional regulator, trigonelline degradation regulator|uniref:HTH-type transcriptional repressor RspR n=1 Tax=Falsiruegeria mediterranea M17 TaxID=1200281 RepID=A0A2R8CDN3_9RHOB|nr:GntR family transcriptional regulator [Falsiruegeria mediterranea]SPJ30566.1 HTH-type transcriptional repressor RspR [Falsiruegeria mediterranea M17]